LFQIIRPFLSDDLSRKISLEGDNYGKMANAIGKNLLEKKIGGNLQNNIPFGKIMSREAIKYDNVFMDMENFGYGIQQV
jgi:hypothetical protein